MKTTVEIPDKLMRKIKVKAAQEGYKIKDLIAVLLERGLNLPSPAETQPEKGSLTFPLVECRPDAPVVSMISRDIHELLHQSLMEDELDRAGLPV